MSIALALVMIPHNKVKATLKAATSPRRAGILVTSCRTVMAAIGINEAQRMATSAAALRKHSSE